MAFRISFCLCYFLLIINIGGAFHVSGANAVEKSLLLGSMLVGILTRKADLFVLGLMVIALLMVFLLGTLTPLPDFRWAYLFGALNQIIVIYCIVSTTPNDQDRETILTCIAVVPILATSIRPQSRHPEIRQRPGISSKERCFGAMSTT